MTTAEEVFAREGKKMLFIPAKTVKEQAKQELEFFGPDKMKPDGTWEHENPLLFAMKPENRKQPKFMITKRYNETMTMYGMSLKPDIPADEHDAFLKKWDLEDKDGVLKRKEAWQLESMMMDGKEGREAFLELMEDLHCPPEKAKKIMKEERSRLKKLFAVKARELKAKIKQQEADGTLINPINPREPVDYGDRKTPWTLVGEDLNVPTQAAQDKLDNLVEEVHPVPPTCEVFVVGAGMAGITVATTLIDASITDIVIVEKSQWVGGVWRQQANSYSRVNSSEPVYRLPLGKKEAPVMNTNHTPAYQLLEDLVEVIKLYKLNFCMKAQVDSVRPLEGDGAGYSITGTQTGASFSSKAKLVTLCTNRRLGTPRELTLPGEDKFEGLVRRGLNSDCEGENMNWKGKHILIVGFGAFALEHFRTGLERGCDYMAILARRRGTVCPQIIDWINFIRPFDKNFEHPKEGSGISFEAWKKCYEESGATLPECWKERPMILKPDGHTVSTSDLFFIAHKLQMATTDLGAIEDCTATSVIYGDGEKKMECDVVIKCVGFNINMTNSKIVNRTHMRGTGLVDRNLWILVESHLDSKIFSSVFGSSYLNSQQFACQKIVELYKDNDMQTKYLEMVPSDADINHVKASEMLSASMKSPVSGRALGGERSDLRKYIDGQAAKMHDSLAWKDYHSRNKDQWEAIHAMLYPRAKSIFKDFFAKARPLPYSIFDNLIEMVDNELSPGFDADNPHHK
eukprot:CAMPEP_0119344808 /NCGR_PEP_ID=MMETSP1333-20130426/107160_1 /TAXON_ID=418940 /ORGANISM="Scyphosphaera apsteinii, Strain RCC1455" /LENGTH=740 /DNA_ID=CAMNT_0007357257 /DNA_START=18 /DNA_END=2240 /DNA_ORIENTATION=+